MRIYDMVSSEAGKKLKKQLDKAIKPKLVEIKHFKHNLVIWFWYSRWFFSFQWGRVDANTVPMTRTPAVFEHGKEGVRVKQN